MPHLLRDLRYAVRVLFRTPGLSLVAILTIALGVGLTTHTFSIVYGSVIRGIPYPGADRLIALNRNVPADGNFGMSLPIHDYVDWRDQQTTFDGLGAHREGTVNLADADQRPDRFLGAWVTSNTFGLVGAEPILGRGFREGEDAPHAEPTIVLGYDVWQSRYGGDPGVLGTTVRANGQMYTVIGVMPEKYKFPFDSTVWLPLTMDYLDVERGQGDFVDVFGRLKEDVTPDQARSEMATIAQRLAEEYPETNAGTTVRFQPYTERYMPSQIIAVMWVMLSAVFGVLLIACSNVANLLLARAATRGKEIAIRTALGASRGAVIRQLLIESLVLALLGGTLGVAMSCVGVELFNASIIDIQKPFWIEIALFPAVLVFAVAITIVASVVSGTIPAFKASGSGAHEILKDASRSSSFRMSRFSNVLVIGEVAVSFGLLVAAGFMIKSIVNVKNVDLGFAVDHLFTARIGLNDADYPDDETRLQFHEALYERLAALPGAKHVSFTSNLPVSGAGMYWYGVEGESYARDQDYAVANRSVITPGFFETFGARIREGRDFTVHDRKGTLEVAIVNTSFARKHFSGTSALGERVRLGRSDTERPWLTIVGVVPDLRIGGGVGGIGSDDRIQEQMYVPLAQNPLQFVSVAIKTASNPKAMAPAVRDAVGALDANLPIYDADSMDGVIQTNTWAFGLFGSLFGMFGGIALFMSAVGLYGVMAFAVNRRRHEMGIRIALGATSRDIARLVFRKAFGQLGIGMAIGLALGAALSSPLRVILFDVDTLDPTVYLTIAVTLAASGLAACVIPARRAARVDVVDVLKPE